MLVKDRSDNKLSDRSVDMVILLTDGMPNSGEHAECLCTFHGCTFSVFSESLISPCRNCAIKGVYSIAKIQENVRNAMGGKMTLFCLGFGNDVDYSFLDKMSKENKGFARRIFEGSDAALQLQVKGPYQ